MLRDKGMVGVVSGVIILAIFRLAFFYIGTIQSLSQPGGGM